MRKQSEEFVFVSVMVSKLPRSWACEQLRNVRKGEKKTPRNHNAASPISSVNPLAQGASQHLDYQDVGESQGGISVLSEPHRPTDIRLPPSPCYRQRRPD